MSKLFVLGLVLVAAGLACGVTLMALGRLAPGLGVGTAGLVAGLLSMLIGWRRERASERAASEHLRRQLAAISDRGQSTRPAGAEAAPAREASPVAPAGLVTEEAAIGEQTMAQVFVPDYSAQPMPGFARIYQQIAAGTMLGFLMVVGGPDRGRGIPIGRERIAIGRGGDCALQLSDPGVSNRQAEVLLEEGHIVIRDLGSKNGTYVNNVRIEKQTLSNCDVIAFGSTRLLVTLGT